MSRKRESARAISQDTIESLATKTIEVDAIDGIQGLTDDTMGDDEKRRLLPELGFLKTLSESLRDQLCVRGEYQRFEAGAEIVEIGEACGGLCVLLSGSLSVERMDTFSWAPLSTLNAGDLLGALEWERGRIWRERVRAVVDSTLLFLSTKTLRSLVERTPTLKDQLVRYSEDHLLQTLLGDHELFQKVPIEARRALAREGRRRRYQRGQEVFSPARIFASIFIVSEGSLALAIDEGPTQRIDRGELAGLEIAIGDDTFDLRGWADEGELELFSIPYEQISAVLQDQGLLPQLRRLAHQQRAQAHGEL